MSSHVYQADGERVETMPVGRGWPSVSQAGEPSKVGRSRPFGAIQEGDYHERESGHRARSRGFSAVVAVVNNKF